MKNIKLVVSVKNKKDMNELIDTVCATVGKVPASMRDKFKMVDQASPEKIMHLCTHLNLNVEFRNSKKVNEIAVELKDVPSDFGKEPEEEKETPKKTEEEITKDLMADGGSANDEDDVPF